MILVDSPGMIDAPAAWQTRLEHATAADRSTAERGYDFLRVTRWLAEHADVILLFFDPDKPGTTGETLECLTTSLSGMEHKLHIVMNKVDQFEHIHDFARAYGSLCWNLSKVIPRKDLPRIYTMYLPPDARGKQQQAVEQKDLSATSLSHALAELSATRDEVLHAVHSAPERRVDNLITRAHDAAALLRMHSVVVDEARRLYTSARYRWFGAIGGLTALSPAAAYLVWEHLSLELYASGAAGGAVLVVAALAGVQARNALATMRSELLSDGGLDSLFRQLYAADVSEGDEYVSDLWRRVRPKLQKAVETRALDGLARLDPRDLASLDEILEQTVPELRRLTSSSSVATTWQVKVPKPPPVENRSE